MSLLTNIMDHALDEGYAEAAARRSADGDDAFSPLHPGWLLAGGLAIVGILLATAAAQTRDRAPAAAQARAALASEVEQRTAANDRLGNDLAQLRASVARARADTLANSSAGAQLAGSLATLEQTTGGTAVVGPALLVRIEDADGSESQAGDPRSDKDGDDGRVTDRDLQTIVNQVWAAGAEAVAVNGQRLTALSAIRSAGEAILVDFRPLSPPYEVLGIGDADELRATFSEGFGGSYLQVLQGYGIEFAIETRSRAQLPASAGLGLRFARAPGDDDTDTGGTR